MGRVYKLLIRENRNEFFFYLGSQHLNDKNIRAVYKEAISVKKIAI